MQSQILNSLRPLPIRDPSETDRVACKVYVKFQVASLWEFNIDVAFYLMSVCDKNQSYKRCPCPKSAIWTG